MAKLSGILEYSMGGFLCLRGYASMKELSEISECKQSYQRELIPEHMDDIADFLGKGEYRFFPEIILSASLLSENNHSEVNQFFETIQRGESWRTSKIGGFQIYVFRHKHGDRNRLVHISFDHTKIKMNRIDGNHRLSAVSRVEGDLAKTPFCLILCRNEDEENKYSRVIFHNINAKHVPLNLEENIRVILEDSIVFPDDKLKNPPFGWEYYLARKTIQAIDYSCFRQIERFIGKSQYSFFVELFRFLLEKGSLESNEQAVDTVKAELSNIDRMLLESEIESTTDNIAVIGALAFYKISNPSKYRGFISWAKRNNIGNVEKLRISDVIRLYDEIYEHVPKKAFLARWYPDAGKDGRLEADKAKHRIQAMQAVADELGLELTDLGTRETGTFDIREVMYRDIRECDIFIADLSGARHNVMIEVGYALKHVGTGRMLFYFQDSTVCNSVPFDVSHLNYVSIVDSGEIRTSVKDRIITILTQAKNGEI